ncbi:MAG: Uma2 family endonuclease [Microcoleaceae cyanobacterium]
MVYLDPRLELKIALTDEQFYQLCQENDGLNFEKTANGELIIMSPMGGITGKFNADLNYQLIGWNRQYQLGEVFDSNTGFKLPNGSDRSPDVAWVKKERWQALTREEQEKFVPLCPDFVIELMSPSDNLEKTQLKMTEYINNGCQLGWLINRKKSQVEIYRPGIDIEILEQPAEMSGESVLPGFILDLEFIW